MAGNFQEEFSVKLFNGGVNKKMADHDILDSQAASAYNVHNPELEGVASRYGYGRYYTTGSALSSAVFNALFVHNSFATSTFIFATNGHLYKDLGSSVTATDIYSGVSTGIIRSFEMEGNLYLLDGSGLLVYDTVSGMRAVTPKIPTYWIDANPSGDGGAQLQELNFLTGAFTQTFNGDGALTGFYMQFGSLVTGTNYVVVNGTTLTSGGDVATSTSFFTVNYTSGIFNIFMSTSHPAPSTGIGNVEITTHKNILDPTEILNNTMCVSYGQANSVNAYLGGNSAHPARMYWSDVQDPSYWPATSYVEVGVKNDKIMGFLSHANSLLIFKYNSIQAWNGSPPNNSLTEIYVGEGLIGTDSLRLADGFPTFYSQRGIVQLQKQDLGYVLELISEDANGVEGVRDGILTESLSSKQNCFAFVAENKYWLYLNGNVWVYQYNLKHLENGRAVYPWLPWHSVVNFNNMKMFAQKDGEVYFAAKGNFFKFDKNRGDDDGNVVSSYWLGKDFHVGESYDIIKSFNDGTTHMRAYSNLATSLVTATFFVAGTDGIGSASRIMTITPAASGLYNEYNSRHFIHYKAPSIQFQIQEGTTSGGMYLQGYKVRYQVERKNTFY